MSEKMGDIRCPKCRARAAEIIHAAANKRRGWYCAECNHFEKAIGREQKR